MKRLGITMGSCLAIMFISSCASLNYNEVAPNAKDFKPTIAVVLPTVKMPEGTDPEGEKVIKAIFDAAVATKRFERVLDPVGVKFLMVENNQLQDAVMNYMTKLRTLGVSDKESCKKIGELYRADTIIIGEVGKWGYATYGGDKTGEVSLAIKMVDASTGSVYWKASHAVQKTYSLFRPDLGNMASDLAKQIFEFMPKP